MGRVTLVLRDGHVITYVLWVGQGGRGEARGSHRRPAAAVHSPSLSGHKSKISPDAGNPHFRETSQSHIRGKEKKYCVAVIVLNTLKEV